VQRFVPLVLPLIACSSEPGTQASHDSGLSWEGDASSYPDTSPIPEAGYPLVDGGFVHPDRFITTVVSFTPGDCAGFGLTRMPSIVYGPPQGAGSSLGSTDVVSFGKTGSIVVAFTPNAIVDGPGPDFVVFENPFFVGGDPNDIYAEQAEVSVSDDGTTWSTFACTISSGPGKGPFGACAGWHPIYSSTTSGISPIDYPASGGDAFDLADLGIKHANFVRITDNGWQTCPTDPSMKMNTNGFDLDAIAILNAEMP
jgi:hypothetical protein